MKAKTIPAEVKEALNEFYNLDTAKVLQFWSDYGEQTYYCVILEADKAEVRLAFPRVFKIGDDWAVSIDGIYSEHR